MYIYVLLKVNKQKRRRKKQRSLLKRKRKKETQKSTHIEGTILLQVENVHTIMIYETPINLLISEDLVIKWLN